MEDYEGKARRLALVSIVETVSFIALVGAMISGSESAVSIVGMIHGLLFLAYALLVLQYRQDFGWSWGSVAVAILTGPVGPIIVLERLRRAPAAPKAS